MPGRRCAHRGWRSPAAAAVRASARAGASRPRCAPRAPRPRGPGAGALVARGAALPAGARSRRAPADARRAAARALRHLTRELVSAEGVQGGFAALYGLAFAQLETLGNLPPRRYFIEGFSRRRSSRCRSRRALCAPSATSTAPARLVLAASDPAQPFGAALPVADRDGHRGRGPARRARRRRPRRAGRRRGPPATSSRRPRAGRRSWPASRCGSRCRRSPTPGAAGGSANSSSSASRGRAGARRSERAAARRARASAAGRGG